MDKERDMVAIEEEQDAAEMTASTTVQEPALSSPFRLTSFGTHEHASAPESGLLGSLLQLNQIRTDNLESMIQTLKKLQEQSRGFLSLTGSPRMEPVVKSITPFRLVVLSVLCLFVWVLFMGWLQPIRGSAALLFRVNPNKPMKWRADSKGSGEEIDKSNSSTRFKSLGIAKTLHWMQHEGIPYLGAIQIAVGASEEKEVGSLTLIREEIQKREVAQSNALIAEAKFAESEQSLRYLKRLSRGALMCWVGLFALRFLFDPLWRELVLVAPLAALSRIISGIQ